MFASTPFLDQDALLCDNKFNFDVLVESKPIPKCFGDRNLASFRDFHIISILYSLIIFLPKTLFNLFIDSMYSEFTKNDIDFNSTLMKEVWSEPQKLDNWLSNSPI